MVVKATFVETDVPVLVDIVVATTSTVETVAFTIVASVTVTVTVEAVFVVEAIPRQLHAVEIKEHAKATGAPAHESAVGFVVDVVVGVLFSTWAARR